MAKLICDAPKLLRQRDGLYKLLREIESILVTITPDNGKRVISAINVEIDKAEALIAEIEEEG